MLTGARYCISCCPRIRQFAEASASPEVGITYLLDVLSVDLANLSMLIHRHEPPLGDVRISSMGPIVHAVKHPATVDDFVCNFEGILQRGLEADCESVSNGIVERAHNVPTFAESMAICHLAIADEVGILDELDTVSAC